MWVAPTIAASDKENSLTIIQIILLNCSLKPRLFKLDAYQKSKIFSSVARKPEKTNKSHTKLTASALKQDQNTQKVKKKA